MMDDQYERKKAYANSNKLYLIQNENFEFLKETDQYEKEYEAIFNLDKESSESMKFFNSLNEY